MAINYVPRRVDVSGLDLEPIDESVDSKFDKAAGFTFRDDIEGGFVVDNGGPTNYGITQNTLNAYQKKNGLPELDVKDITPEYSRKIAKEKYYDKPGFDAFPEGTASLAFDFGFNAGPSRSIRIIQDIVGAKADGVNGPKTKKAVSDYVAKNGEKTLNQNIADRIKDYYIKITDGEDPKKRRNGYMNRINKQKERLDLSFLNPFYTPEASAEEIPSPYPDIDLEPVEDTSGLDLEPLNQTSQKKENGFTPGQQEVIDQGKAGLLGAGEIFLGRTGIYKDPEIKKLLEDHPIAKGIGEVGRDLALLNPISEITLGVTALPFVARLAQGLSKAAEVTNIGKKFLNIGEATRYVAKSVHSGATFATLQAVKEATIEKPDESFVKSLVNVATQGLFGSGLGLFTGAPNYIARSALSAVYGGVTTGIQGGSPLDVALNSVLFGGFELINGKSIDRNIKLQALNNMKKAIGEFLIKGGKTPDEAVAMAETALNNSIKNSGGLDNVLDNNTAPFMNQLASEMQKQNPMWSVSKPKTLPDGTPFESGTTSQTPPTEPKGPVDNAPDIKKQDTSQAALPTASEPLTPEAPSLSDVNAGPVISPPAPQQGDLFKNDTTDANKQPNVETGGVQQGKTGIEKPVTETKSEDAVKASEQYGVDLEPVHQSAPDGEETTMGTPDRVKNLVNYYDKVPDFEKDPVKLRKEAEAIVGGNAKEYYDELYDSVEMAANKKLRLIAHTSSGLKQMVLKARELESSLPLRSRSLETIKNQQFSTPLPLAVAANHLLAAGKGDIVMEPTAGTGNLIVPFWNGGWELIANELDPRRVEVLKNAGFPIDIIQGDFLAYKGKKPTAIIANPPFGALGTGKYKKFAADYQASNIDQQFIEKMLRLLPDGGRIAVITSMGTGSGASGNPFRRWLEKNHTFIASIASPKEAYKYRGAPTVETALLMIEKGKGRGDVRPLIKESVKDWDEYTDIINGLRAQYPRLEVLTKPEEKQIIKTEEPKQNETAPAPVKSVGRERAGEHQEVSPRLSDTGGSGGASDQLGDRPAVVRPEQPESVKPIQDDVEQGVPTGGSGSRQEPSSGRSSRKRIGSFVEYKRHNVLPVVNPHPSVIVESQELASVSPPKITITPGARLMKSYKDGHISDQQMDVVLLAIQSIKNGKGFLISDDVGVGKTREMAGIILDALDSGKANRVLYVSLSPEILDGHINNDFSTVMSGKPGAPLPYETVRLESFPNLSNQQNVPVVNKAIYTVTQPGMRKHHQRVMEIGFDLIVIDEAHKWHQTDDRTATGIAWDRIHKAMAGKPMVYATATPGIDLNGLGYLYGLGEWTKETYDQYLANITGDDVMKAGMFARTSSFASSGSIPLTQQFMREMKMKGLYASRDLARENVKFGVKNVPFTKDDIEQYDKYMEFLTRAYKVGVRYARFDKVKGKRSLGLIKSLMQFAAKRHQVDLKVARIIDDVKKDIASGKRVFIFTSGLNELDPDAPKGYARAVIDKINEDRVEKLEGEILSEKIPESIEAKELLLEEFNSFPPQLSIESFVREKLGGQYKVGFYTGNTTNSNKARYLKEWMAGKIDVMLGSDAAKTAISAHDTIGKEIVNYYLDIDFEVTKFKQALGRTNRAGEKSSPTIIIPALGAAGEQKFVATIASRMKSLGATSKGQAESGVTDFLSEFDLDGAIAHQAARNTFNGISDSDKELFLNDMLWETDPQGGRRVKRVAPNGYYVDFFLYDLNFMPYEEGNRMFKNLIENYKHIVETSQTLNELRAERLKGKEVRTIDLFKDEKDPNNYVVMHEVLDESGHRFGILSGMLLDKSKVLNNHGIKRFIKFTTPDGILSGKKALPSAMATIAKEFGKDIASSITADNAFEVLMSGDKVPVIGEMELYKRQNGMIGIKGAKMSDKNNLIKAGAAFSPVGSAWMLKEATDQAVKDFIKFYPLSQSDPGAVKEEQQLKNKDTTKFSQYQLPGGENYEEGQALFEKNEKYGKLKREEDQAYGSREKASAAIREALSKARRTGVSGDTGSVAPLPKFAKQFILDRGINLVGQEVKTAQDAAQLAALYRNPFIENFQIMFLKDGKVAAHQVFSSGQIDTVKFDNVPKLVHQISSAARRLGSTEIVLAHNHPTGNPTPSIDFDLPFTQNLGSRLQKNGVTLKDHIVTNGDKFAQINADLLASGDGFKISSYEKALPQYPRVLERTVVTAANVADIARKYYQKGTVSIIYRDSKGMVMDVDHVNDDKNIAEYTRQMIEAYKANKAIIVYNDTGPKDGVVRGMLHYRVLDVIQLTDKGYKQILFSNDPEPQYGARRIREEEAVYGDEEMAGKFESLTPEEQAQFQLEMDDIRKTPEGNLLVAIKKIGGIAPHRSGKLKEEYAQLPLYLKNNKGRPLDEFLGELKQYGWNFDTEDALIQEIKHVIANPVHKVDRASLKKIIREAQKNKALSNAIERRLNGEKERRFIKTVREAANTDPAVARTVEGSYQPISNQASVEEAKAFLASDREKAEFMVWKKGPISRIEATLGALLLNEYAVQKKHSQAKALAEHIAERGTLSGQGVQALYIYERLSPEGMLVMAQNVIRQARSGIPQGKLDQFEKLARALNSTDREKLARKLGIPYLTDEFLADLMEMADDIQAMPDGREKLIATAIMLKQIADKMPRSLWRKISMAQTISQLLNPKTLIRNILGNLIFFASENIADIVATGIDVSLALATKQRTVYLPNMPGQVKSAIQGFRESAQEIKLGINLKNVNNFSQFAISPNSVFADKTFMGSIEKWLRYGLGPADRAFWQAAYDQSIANQLRSSKLTEPTMEQMENAVMLANYRTFQDDNIISRQFVAIKKLFNVGKEFGLGDIIIKYAKTTANLFHRGIEYSPLGFAHTLMRLADPYIFGNEFNQEKFSRQTARAIVGTALFVGAGALLAMLGIISGKRAKDQDISETRKNTGIREYQINMTALKRFLMSGLDPETCKMQENDMLVNYDWIQPAAIGIALGANMVINPRNSLVDHAVNVADGFASASETLQEQPLMTGIKRFTNQRNWVSSFTSAAQDIPASFVPTVLNEVRQLTDNIARNVMDPDWTRELVNKVAMKIPVASSRIPAKINTLGEESEIYQGGSNNPFNVFLNPAFVSRYKPDPVSKMVLDIWEKTGETEQFPRVPDKKFKPAGGMEPQPIGAEQYLLYSKYIGHKTNVLFNMLQNDPKFMRLDDLDKAKKLSGYLTDIKQAANIEILGVKPARKDRGAQFILKQISDNNADIKKNSPVNNDDINWW